MVDITLKIKGGIWLKLEHGDSQLPLRRSVFAESFLVQMLLNSNPETDHEDLT